MSGTSGGGILKADEESDAEVRRVDQDNINRFGRLNARLHELREERDEAKVSTVAAMSVHTLALT